MSFYAYDDSLDRSGYKDAVRHLEIIRDIVRKNAKDILIRDSIISTNPKTKIYVPITGVIDPHFAYAKDTEGTAAGNGEEQEGDIIGEEEEGSESGGGHGGVGDVYETEITLEELAEILFEGLELPNLQEKGEEVAEEKVEWKDIHKRGSLNNINKRRTVKENIKRNSAKGNPVFADLDKKDLRFNSWREIIKYRINAVMFCLMDTSGSIEEWQIYAARLFYFWMVTFLRKQYDNVKIVFIVHDSEAREVIEDNFFKKSSGGGTEVSSAYNLALKIIEERFPVDNNNIYVMHFSDGDNYGYDNENAIEALNKLCAISNLVGYGEVNSKWKNYGTLNTLYGVYDEIVSDRFIKFKLLSADDVLPAIRIVFGARDV